MSSTRSVLRPTVNLFLWLAFIACSFAPTVRAQSGVPSRSASNEGAEADQQVGYLLADKIYTQPDAFSQEVSSITRDDQVRVSPVADKQGWYEVYEVEGSQRMGYAFRPYVSRFGSAGLASYKTDEGASTSKSQPLFEVVFADIPADAGVRRTVNEWANVRVGPGMGHEAFGVIRPGVPFQVLAVERGWGKVRLVGDQTTGYVSAVLLRRLPEPESVLTVAEAEEPATETVETETVEPVRSAVTGGGAAGGGAGSGATEASQAEALRHVLSGSPVDGETVVYVTRTGHKFHREGCKHLRSRTFAIPLAEAMLDYSPCRTCKPLQPNDGGEGGE